MTLQQIEERLGYLINVLDRNKEIVSDINKELYYQSSPIQDGINKLHNQSEVVTEDGYLYRISNLLTTAGNIADNEWGILQEINRKLKEEILQACEGVSQY